MDFFVRVGEGSIYLKCPKCSFNLKRVIIQFTPQYVRYFCEFCDQDLSTIVKSPFISVDLAQVIEGVGNVDKVE
ncbi:MAG: hypothetical protein ACXABY_04395 [Candidatus Thorarchaeota archaeon]|jgi:hypothetical protein